MSRPVTAILVFAAVGVLGVHPAADAGGRKHGSFIARAAPLPALDPDVYYPRKTSCLQGAPGVHYVAKPFRAPGAGTLVVYLEGFEGDWDIYVLNARLKRLGSSEDAQVLSGAAPAERLSVRITAHRRITIVACNWLGEPQVEVHYQFAPAPGGGSRHRRG
jgi:hypothetical protein